jgi:transposase, IS5 family
VHFPTDIGLLFDATRKVIQQTTRLCRIHNVPGWRQSKHNIKSLKRQIFKLQKLKHSSSKNPIKVAERKKQIESAYKDCTDAAEAFIEKAKESEKELLGKGAKPTDFFSIHYFTEHAERQVEQIIRRVLNDEKIPHEEKVFSVFEEHTEWICKGKAGVPVELGLRVAIVEDQHGFILNHMVMKKQTDEKVALPLIKETKEKFPTLASCSFDKGFHSPTNQDELKKLLKVVALPKKGRLSGKDQEYQDSEEFRKAKKKHSAVESAINALGVHGLDRCPDHGLDGFERYVELAIFARNVQIIGSILLKREAEDEKKKRRRSLEGNQESA